MDSAKLVFLIVEDGIRDDVRETLASAGVEHFTLWSGAEGAGETGPKQGTPVWPGLNDMFMIALPADRVQPLVETMHALQDSYPMRPGMRFMVVDAEFI